MKRPSARRIERSSSTSRTRGRRRHRARRGRRPRRSGLIRPERQRRRRDPHHESGAAPVAAGFDLEGPALTLHDAERDRQPESGALPLGLGGEEGLEDPGQHFGRDARSAVLHRELPSLAGAGAFHPDPAVLARGVNGVDDQVGQHLLQSERVGRAAPACRAPLASPAESAARAAALRRRPGRAPARACACAGSGRRPWCRANDSRSRTMVRQRRA